MPNDATPEISKVGLKLPPFWDKQPELWFVNIEAQFANSGIEQDKTKYFAVVGALNSDVLTYVSDIVLTPPDKDRYDTLKNRLITNFSDSEQKRIQTLLSELTLGDDRPSHLLRKMKQLAGDKVKDDFLKTLWLQRLPQQAQAILSVTEDTLALDKLAVMADKISDSSFGSVSEIQKDKQSELSELKAQISELSEQVRRLSRPRDKSPGRRRFNYRNRSKSARRQQSSNKCWYHENFGAAAKKCRSPCSERHSEN